MTCHTLSPGGHIECSREDDHERGHVWLGWDVADRHDESEARDE